LKLLSKNVLIILSLLFTTTTANANIKEKKKYFREIIAPAVDEVYNELNSSYLEVSKHIKNSKYSKKISKLKKIYHVKTDKELLMALKPHPRSIAMAQAAIESAWAKSRFFKEANNVFGVWSFNKNEPRIAALQKRGKKTVWLKKYSNIKESVRDYYKTLAHSYAFGEFRELKMKTDNPYELVKKLENYSEIGNKYTKDLISIIRYNKFYLYDK